MFMGAGLLCGSILLRMKKKMNISISILINSISVLSITILLTGLFKQLNLKILYPYLLIMATIGVCISWASVLWQTLLQSSTPKNMMGRIFSVSALLGNTSLPIAYGLFGMLLSIFTLPVLLFISGFFLVIFCIILFVKSKNLIPLTITEE
jgi:MFS family permease